MIHVTPGKMLATSRVIEFVTEVAVFPVEQIMDEHSERREEIHRTIQRCQPRTVFSCLLAHQSGKGFCAARPHALFVRLIRTRRDVCWCARKLIVLRSRKYRPA